VCAVEVLLLGGGGVEVLIWRCLFTGLVGEEGSATGVTRIGMAANHRSSLPPATKTGAQQHRHNMVSSGIWLYDLLDDHDI
jgi:hypothetical protein